MAKRHYLADVLSGIERSFLKYHHESALYDAAELRAAMGLGMPRWMCDALAKRAVHGKPKKKSGPRGDILRDCIWFNMVQKRRDRGATKRNALERAVAELSYYGETIRGKPITYEGLEKIYKRQRKKVRRGFLLGLGRCWVPRDHIYDEGLSAGKPCPPRRIRKKSKKKDAPPARFSPPRLH